MFDIIVSNASENVTKQSVKGSFMANTTTQNCRLINLANGLPFFVMGLDLFLLLIMSLLKLVASLTLIRNYNKREKLKLKSTKQFSILNRFYQYKMNAPNSNIRGSSLESSRINSESVLNTPETNTQNEMSFEIDIEQNRVAKPKVKLARVVSSGKIYPKNQDRYFFVNCIFYVSIFGALLELPSVITRNILIICIFVSNLRSGQENGISSSVNSQFDSVDYGRNLTYSSLNQSLFSNISTNNTLEFGFDPYAEQIESESLFNNLLLILEVLCAKFDYLLLISSSHKFFIFLFKCYLIKFPKWTCIRSMLFKNQSRNVNF